LRLQARTALILPDMRSERFGDNLVTTQGHRQIV
jgi:hypothetical protein